MIKKTRQELLKALYMLGCKKMRFTLNYKCRSNKQYTWREWTIVNNNV